MQRVTGQSLTAYLQPRLFDPLGIAPPYWDAMGGSRQVGFIGLHLATEDLARFGLLYLQDGFWRGSPILPPGWTTTASRALTPTGGEPNPDWQQGYGCQFWRSRHGYRADGAFGQLVLVLPEAQAVVVATADTDQTQLLLDAVWTHVYPALTRPGSAVEDGRLTQRLRTLALPVDGACTQPGGDWVTATAVTPDQDGWALTLVAGGQTVAVVCGTASGGAARFGSRPTVSWSWRPRAAGRIPTRSWPSWCWCSHRTGSASGTCRDGVARRPVGGPPRCSTRLWPILLHRSVRILARPGRCRRTTGCPPGRGPRTPGCRSRWWPTDGAR